MTYKLGRASDSLTLQDRLQLVGFREHETQRNADPCLRRKTMQKLCKKKEAGSSLSKKEELCKIPNLLRSSNPTSRSGNTLTCNFYLLCLRLNCSDTGRDGWQTAMICDIIFILRTSHYQVKALPFFLLSGTTPILVQCHLKLSVILFECKSIDNSQLNIAGRTIKTCVHLQYLKYSDEDQAAKHYTDLRGCFVAIIIIKVGRCCSLTCIFGIYKVYFSEWGVSCCGSTIV